MADDLSYAVKPRTLVLCFDGTDQEYDVDNTNIVKFFSLLRKDCMDKQLCYYQAGIGTYFEPGVVSPLFEWVAKILDLAFAWYLDAHVIGGYKFLMQNYRTGDKICIFGFSRGAYTARALGGLLYKVGLLPRGNDAQIPFAYRMYKRTDAKGIQLCAGFKQTYCRTVNIEFMGVWDTVASVGVISGRTLPFTNSNNSIRTFRHALSLDEHRAKFRPSNYQVRPGMESEASTCSRRSPTTTTKLLGSSGRKHSVVIKKTGKAFAPVLIEEGPPDNVLEVWFAGCHADVGGGAVSNSTASSLADISLRWMVREVVASGCGIIFDVQALERVNITLNEPTAADLGLDKTNVVRPLHDALKSNLLWWLLEIIPLQYSWQDGNCVWHTEFNFHLGRGRKIMDPQPKFHSSVQQRMNAMNYKPRARWTAGTEVYVE